MDFSKNYYRTLGCSPNADQTEIQAAYRSLAKKHHPDVNHGSEESKASFQEIQEAFEVLSDLTKRTYYDSMRSGTGGREYAPGEAPDNTTDTGNEALDRRWLFIEEYYPEIASQANELGKISPNLRVVFQIILLETKSFSESQNLFLAVEKLYLTKYFGNNERIQRFASGLLRGVDVSNRRKALIELNQAIVAMGSNAPADKVIENITKKYGIELSKAENTNFSLKNNNESWDLIYDRSKLYGWVLKGKKGLIRGASFLNTIDGTYIEAYSPEEARRAIGIPVSSLPPSLLETKRK